MNINQVIADLQQRIETAQRERIRAEATRDSAAAAAENARNEMEREFSVRTAEQASAKLGEMQKELEQIAASIASALDKAGA